MDSTFNFGFIFVRLQIKRYSNVDLLKIGISKDSVVEFRISFAIDFQNSNIGRIQFATTCYSQRWTEFVLFKHRKKDNKYRVN